MITDINILTRVIEKQEARSKEAYNEHRDAEDTLFNLRAELRDLMRGEA